MPEHTATVEVLTAEVRVLMVGSRQVTLSVYNQLDLIDPKNIKPFGRVSARSDEHGYVYVIGSDHDGVLSRARNPCSTEQIRASVLRRLRRLPLNDDDDMAHCIWQLRDNPDSERILKGPRYVSREKAIQFIAENDDRVDRILVYEIDAQRYAAMWRQLPLIVLAGLR